MKILTRQERSMSASQTTEPVLVTRAGKQAAFYSPFVLYQNGDFKSGLRGDTAKSQGLVEKSLE